MHKGLLPLALVALSSTAGAQVPQKLWGNVFVGMSKEAFKAAYPSQQVDLGNGCHAAIRPQYDHKLVFELTLFGEWDDPFTCAEDIRKSLLTKYGQPRSEELTIEDGSSPLVGGNAKRYIRLRQLAAPDANRTLDEVSTITWFTGNTLITLRLNHTLKTWRVRYQQASIREPAITDKM